jgi:hypothetical protein
VTTSNPPLLGFDPTSGRLHAAGHRQRAPIAGATRRQAAAAGSQPGVFPLLLCQDCVCMMGDGVWHAASPLPSSSCIASTPSSSRIASTPWAKLDLMCPVDQAELLWSVWRGVGAYGSYNRRVSRKFALSFSQISFSHPVAPTPHHAVTLLSRHHLVPLSCRVRMGHFGAFVSSFPDCRLASPKPLLSVVFLVFVFAFCRLHLQPGCGPIIPLYSYSSPGRPTAQGGEPSPRNRG